MVRFYEGADGLKTGHTDAAQYCLAATAKRKGVRLIGIVLGVPNSKVRNTQAMQLLGYGFNNVKQRVLKKSGEVVSTLKLDKADISEIQVKLKDDLIVVENLDGEEHKYTYDIVIDDVKLPIQANTVVGKIKVKEGKNVVSTMDLIVDKKVEKLSYLDLFLNSLLNIFSGEI